ncbi:ribonucleoside-triphosphate reductase, adenosylcobalamin-dependent [Bacillus andreraoultii]|uniref:ribonucleoside-triphosphate reductase, adenosylcobalamin-dependent n=1 Tax=Bacillus andreraoultii TaxID=1499685 RepID=UPI00053AA255|nr:ribonucleoside-triphosphate reductase, adenosylcobalamin-dependent [Bacillus andreraoultii]
MNFKIRLPQSFIDEVKQTLKPHWGALGWVTYKRTYARWIENENRNEEWHETVKRVVEGNINLDPRLKAENVPLTVLHELEHEAKQLYKLIYGLAGAASGRNLWISGTDFQQRNGDALNNCWFIAIRPQAYGDSHILPFYLKDKDQITVSMPFSFTFDQLMKGGGVGFSVVKENMAKMPKVDRKVELVVIVGKENGDYNDIIQAGAIDRDEFYRNLKEDEPKTIVYKTDDSREGWVISDALVIDSHFTKTIEDVERIVIDVTDVREKGKRIKGFGGVASGAKPLVELMFKVNEILNVAFGRRITSVEATDILNLIGKTVVAGNVRRSAEIALGSPEDSEYITMKQDKEALMSHRWASNNSVIVDRSFDDYGFIASSIAVNGEPGIVNIELIRDFGRIIDGLQKGIDGDAEGTNPCGEISLENGENCNLFEIFPLVAKKQGWDLEEAFALATRYAKRVTFSNYEWEVTRKVIEKNRRIGVSMSGIQDWVLKDFGGRLVVGFQQAYDDNGNIIEEPIFNKEAAKVIDGLYKAVVQADKEYSAKLGCNESIKHTTVKPSGTVSKLVGVSEGIHYHYDKYIIQRIRFQENDPLVPAIKAAGYHVEQDAYSANTVVAEFLVKAPSADEEGFVGANDVSIEEQFANQAFMQTYWADNSVSCTITFQEHEKEKIKDLLVQYKDEMKSTTLLPFSGHGYVQAPKEPISKEEYEKRIANIKGDVQTFYNLMQDIQAMMANDVKEGEFEIVGQQDCEGGACPIK